MKQRKFGLLIALVLIVALVLVSQLIVTQNAEAQVPCIETQDPFWATYTGNEGGCSGEAYNCQVFTYSCG